MKTEHILFALIPVALITVVGAVYGGAFTVDNQQNDTPFVDRAFNGGKRKTKKHKKTKSHNK